MKSNCWSDDWQCCQYHCRRPLEMGCDNGWYITCLSVFRQTTCCCIVIVVLSCHIVILTSKYSSNISLDACGWGAFFSGTTLQANHRPLGWSWNDSFSWCLLFLSFSPQSGCFFFFCWFLSLWRLQDWTCIYEVMIDGSFSKGKDMIETEATTRQPIEAWRPGTNLRAPCGLFGSLSQRDWWPMAETSIAEDTWLNAVDRRIQECRSVCWFEFTILVASIYYLCQETTWSLFLFWLFTERWSLACNFQCLHQQWFQLVSVTKTGFNFAPST